MPQDEDTQPLTRVDPRAEPSEAKPTVNLPAMTDRALLEDLFRTVKGGFAEINVQLVELKGADKDIADEVHRVRRDVVDLRSDSSRHEEEIRRLSMRTKGTDENTSKADLDMAAALAAEKTAREALASEHAETKKDVADIKKEMPVQTAYLKTIAGIVDTPMARRLGYAVAGLLLAALTTATGYFARGNVQQQPTVIQIPAPPAVQVPR